MGLRFLDLFAGIGGFRLGMEAASHKCVGFVECDPYCGRCKKITEQIQSDEKNLTICKVCGKKNRQHARFSYEAIHDTEGEWTASDITTVSDESIRGIGSVDVITGGFPCQAFSIAGKREGFRDIRGTLFFEIMRFASILRPKYLFLENVKGLLNHEQGDTFETILRTMDELGFDAEWQVLNSKDYGVPQNRERVFIIGHLRGSGTRKVFPVGSNCQTNEINIIGSTKGEDCSRYGQKDYVYDPKGLIGCLTATDYKQPKQIVQAVLTTDRHGVMINDQPEVWDMYNKRKRTDGNVGTLTANGNTSFTHSGTFGISDGYRIRKLTPRECWRLQGFPDWAFNKAAQVNSDSQLYKQAGNSVTVQVIQAIAERLEVF